MTDAIQFKRKKPRLKFEILECLALRGKVSKSGLKDMLQDRYYADISHSVDELKDREYIKAAKREAGRGKEQVYYAISEKGLRALLLDDDFAALRFWEIIYDFCLNNDELVTIEKIDEFYQIVIRRYLKYSNHGFSSMVDNFHRMCDKWLDENILRSNGITVAQKVIEVLALNPKMTSKELCKQTGESEYDISKVLSPPLKPFYGLTQDAALESLGKSSQTLPESYSPEYDLSSRNHSTEYSNFIIQNIITSRLNKAGDLTYELSLFGVMLSLVIIRCNDLSILRAGLYFENFSIQEYYAKIASKYKEKLPLIFRKWNLLTRILKVFAVYNLDIVVDKKNSSNNTLPEIVGGNKELWEGMSGIILYNKMFMEAFASAGSEVLKEYFQGMFFRLPHILRKPEFKKVYPLLYKLADVGMMLQPTAIVFPIFNSINFKTREINSVLSEMEKFFADEITALYYTNLCSETNVRVSNLTRDDSSKLLECSPIECLSTILQEDKEGSLKEWYTRCMKDLENFQEDVPRITRARMRQMSME